MNVKYDDDDNDDNHEDHADEDGGGDFAAYDYCYKLLWL